MERHADPPREAASLTPDAANGPGAVVTCPTPVPARDAARRRLYFFSSFAITWTLLFTRASAAV